METSPELPGPLEWTHKLALLVGDPDISLTLELWQLWCCLGPLPHDTRPRVRTALSLIQRLLNLSANGLRLIWCFRSLVDRLLVYFDRNEQPRKDE